MHSLAHPHTQLLAKPGDFSPPLQMQRGVVGMLLLGDRSLERECSGFEPQGFKGLLRIGLWL